MSGPEEASLDEFEFIARVLRPLTGGAPEALSLADDAAVIPPRAGYELVITTDTLVEGVHFLAADPPDLVARKLLRVNLSDLAAKAAEPYGYFLSVSWPQSWGADARGRFAAGLAEDQARFGLRLFGGDTTSTLGPLTASATLLGWAPEGKTVKRCGASPGDLLVVSGSIGDGCLGLKAARGELEHLGETGKARLAERYHLPEPRLGLLAMLRAHASASADVSDGLIADAGHIASASGLGAVLDLERLPLSAPAAAWLDRQPDRRAGLVDLATGGDDYEVVCTISRDSLKPALVVAEGAGIALTPVGEIIADGGLRVHFNGAAVRPERAGWRHS